MKKSRFTEAQIMGVLRQVEAGLAVGLCILETIAEVQQIGTEWLWADSNERPTTCIGGVTPAMKLKVAA